MSLLLLLVFFVVLRILAVGRTNPHPNVDMSGKVVLVTGANTGLGFETALALAKLNATVVIAGRSRARIDEAARQIAAELASLRGVGAADGGMPLLDLESLESVRAFAREFLRRYQRLDVLVLNAGVMLLPRGRTREGFETHMGVNHLAHHLLARLLLGALETAARRTGDARVLVVSSVAHMAGDLRGDGMQDLNYRSRPYTLLSRFGAYAQSKLANVLFALELARRQAGSGVRAFSLHPGAVHTELYREVPYWGTLEFVLWPLLRFFFKTPLQGAQTQIYLALAPLQELEAYNGRYFSNCAHSYFVNLQVSDSALGMELWRKSEALVGL